MSAAILEYRYSYPACGRKASDEADEKDQYQAILSILTDLARATQCFLGFTKNNNRSDSKSTIEGIITGVLGIIILITGFQASGFTQEQVTNAQTIILITFTSLWAIYLLLLSAISLWKLDEKPVSFYNLFLGIISIVFAIYLSTGDSFLGGTINNISSGLLTICAIILAIYAIINFFLLRPELNNSRTTRLTLGGINLGVSIILILAGSLGIIGAML